MILSDVSIRDEIRSGRIVIDPLGDGAIQPASVDIRLGEMVCSFEWDNKSPIDVVNGNVGGGRHSKIPSRGYSLEPNAFLLAHTKEVIKLPSHLAARVEGKSSLGRVGLLIHSTAGYVDPGWRGQLTLELHNVNSRPILLHADMWIGQISFMRLTTPSELLYGSSHLKSKYQDSYGVVESLYGGRVDN